MAESLKAVFTRIKDAADDIASLDVVTLTGDVDIQGSNNKVDLKKLYQTIQANAISKTNMSLVAYTHLDFDSDAVLFVKGALSEGEKPLVDAHNAMVKASQEARLAFVRAIKDVIGL